MTQREELNDDAKKIKLASWFGKRNLGRYGAPAIKELRRCLLVLRSFATGLN